MKQWKKRAVSIVAMGALAVGLTGGLAACHRSSGGGSGVKIMYSTNQLDDFRTLLLEGVKSAASSEGVTLDAMEPCETADAQIAQFKSAADSGYDAIICLPVEADTA
ncbi:MAG: hypothetical protein IJ679_12420, partial [Lachnospiraceae bacterium]|nr:hypothetical protein [Lachnospiraceae bacterium]